MTSQTEVGRRSVLPAGHPATRNRALRAACLGLWLAAARVMAGAAYDDVTFFIGSDLHYGYTNGTTLSADLARATLDGMNALPGQPYPASVGGGTVDVPRGVLLAGDLTETGAAAEWTALTNDWGLVGERRLAFPVYEGFGNHDYWAGVVANGIKSRNPRRPGVVKISDNGYHYSWDWGALHLVCLNLFPGDTKDVYGLDPLSSLSFLADDLAQNVGSSGRPVVIFHHYGFDSFGLGWWTDTQRSNYFATIQNYNVIAILAGHNHLVDNVPWNGLSTFNDGTVSKPIGSPYVNFLVVHMTPTNLVVAGCYANGAWGPTYTVPITVSNTPAIIIAPQPLTATFDSSVALSVRALGTSLAYQWVFDGSNAIPAATNSVLTLSHLSFAQSGSYSVVVSNPVGSVGSPAASVTVVAPLQVSGVPMLSLSGDPGSQLALEFRGPLNAGNNWAPLTTVILTNPSQPYVDTAWSSQPFRFYRLHPAAGGLVALCAPAITVFGGIGDRLRLERQDPLDPASTWVPLVVLTLTNTSQLYIDTTAAGRPLMSYRAIGAP